MNFETVGLKDTDVGNVAENTLSSIFFLPEVGHVKQHLPNSENNVDGFLYIKYNVLIN
jgi:hypothetical protein